MKPLATTAGMREGSTNEVQVLMALPDSFDRHGIQNGSQYDVTPAVRHKVQYIRAVGPLGSSRVELLAGSPDSVAAISNCEGDVYVAAIEVKTMTALNTKTSAKAVGDKHGKLCMISGVGQNRSSTTLFHALVPTTAYRLQCLHHAAVLG